MLTRVGGWNVKRMLNYGELRLLRQYLNNLMGTIVDYAYA